MIDAPAYRIGDPRVDGGFIPSGTMNADPYLTREAAITDLSVKRGTGQAGSIKNSGQAKDTIRFGHIAGLQSNGMSGGLLVRVWRSRCPLQHKSDGVVV